MPPSAARTSASVPRASMEWAAPRCCHSSCRNTCAALAKAASASPNATLYVVTTLEASSRRIGGESLALRTSATNGQGLVVDGDEGGGVLGDVTVVGDHDRDRLADVACLAVGKRERPGLVERHARIGMPHHPALHHHAGKIVEREHRVYAGQRQRRGLVDRANERVRMRAAHERRVPGARARRCRRRSGRGRAAAARPPAE